MTTAELIEKLRVADPTGTAIVWIQDGDYGHCAPLEPIEMVASIGHKTGPYIVLEANPDDRIW